VADKQLTEAELADLVDFLGALDCGGKLEEPPPVEGGAPKAGKAK
jgi:hypothetical protein